MKSRYAAALFVAALSATVLHAALGFAAAPPSRYSFPSSGTVLDTRTLLTWQQATDGKTYTWLDAKTYCAGLSLAGNGWRLPSVGELLTLVDVTAHDPAIDPTAFPATPTTSFWSSSTYAGATTLAWTVDFGQGYSNSQVDKTAVYRVRCVR
jgi:hypothetical protein